ncbi:MAG TPA: substrate-binding domain-containing protein [Terriglobia bacterium]
MRHAPRIRTALTCGFISLMIACSPPPHQGERYVFVSSNINIPYWQDAKAGFLDSAKALKGVKADFVGPNRYAPDAELQAFQEAVTSQPAGILISPAQADLFKGAIDGAVAAGIPVICVDSDSPGSNRNMFVGTDNYQAGLRSGSETARLLHGHGVVVVIKIAGQLNQEERARGLRDAFKQYPGLGVGAELNDSGDAQQAGDLVSTLIHNAGHPAAFICLEASCGPGVGKALDGLGMAGSIPIVAMDANPETLNLIGQGYIAATVAQKPYTMGYYGLQFLDDLHHNRIHEFPDWRTAPASPLPAIVDTGTVVVDSGNLQTYLAAIAGPKS